MNGSKIPADQRATILIALITTIGVILSAYFTFRSNITSTELPIRSTQTAESMYLTLAPALTLTAAELAQATGNNAPSPAAAEVVPPTATPEPPTAEPTATDTAEPPTPAPPTAESSTEEPTSAPEPTVDNSPETVAANLLAASKQLPSLINDAFVGNSGGWYTGKNTNAQGLGCEFSIYSSFLSILARTGNSASICSLRTPKPAKDFYLSLEAQVVNNRDADASIYYRYVDNHNYYFVTLNPKAQTYSFGVTKNGAATVLVDSAPAATINQNNINKVVINAVGSAHAVYINDRLVTMVTDDSILDAGDFYLNLHLFDPNETEELLVDNFMLQGE